MADTRLAFVFYLKISFFFLNVEHGTSERDLESTFTKIKLGQTFSMRYGIGNDQNSNFVFIPGRYTEVIFIYRSENSGRKSEFRSGRLTEHLKYSARYKNYSRPKKCVAILRWS